MAQNKDISIPINGMNQDLRTLNLDSKAYPFALNATLEDFSGNGFPAIQNDSSNLLAVNFPLGFQVIGKASVYQQNRVIYMLVNPETGESQIGEVIGCEYNDDIEDNHVQYECDANGCVLPANNYPTPLEDTNQVPFCSYRTINSAPCLNFSIDYPIDIEYRITDCGLNIYFTDNLNQRRYLYFDYMNNNPREGLVVQNRFLEATFSPSGDCVQPEYSVNIDCNKIAYNPLYTTPCVALVDVVQGGSLKAGDYQFLISYADISGNPLTQYFPATNPIPIFTREITFETNYKTDKAIELNIENLDQTTLFVSYNVIVAETIDNFTQFKLVGTFPVSRNRIVYTGDDPTLPILTAPDIFFKRPFYNTASSVTSANNYLFFSGLKSYNQANFQRVANNVKIKWETVAIPEAVYRDPKNVNRFRTYMRDEVYPFALIFELTEGDQTCALHIPAPNAQYYLDNYALDVNEIIDNNDVQVDTTCGDLTRNKAWQVYNLGLVTGTPHELTPNCDDINCWEYGEFSYWESIDRYPNDPVIWGELCGQPIRYHKFPDSCVTHIHDGLDGTNGFNNKNFVYPIGVSIDHQSIKDALADAVTAGLITQADADRVKGYRLVRGNRVGHESIVAKGLLYDMWDYQKFGNTYYYANYPYNDLQNDDFISNNPNTYQGSNTSDPDPNVFRKSSRYTFHSPDTHFVNPTLGTEIKLETEEYGQSQGFFNHCEDQAKYKLLSTVSMTVAFAAGVAAALSATTEKSCTDYTQAADFKQTQVSNGTMYIATGGSSTNTLTPGDLVEATGTSGTSGNIDTHMSASSQDLSLGERKEEHNDPYTNLNFQPYNVTTGQSATEPIIRVSDFKKTTCTGTTYQILSPLSGSIVGFLLQQAVYQAMLGISEMQLVIDLLNSLIPFKNLAIQYNSAGIYNNYKCVANNEGEKIRAIIISAYLKPEVQLVNESFDNPSGQFDTVYINNWNRESSVYLKTDNSIPLPNPTVTDNSRGTMDNFGLGFDDLNQRVLKDISSYYASIKNFIPDQYGDIFEVNYLETNPCSFNINGTYDTCSHVFGGDTFITRFALKIKVPFFLQTRFKEPNQSDVIYSDLGNVGFPNYYFNTPQTLLERIDGDTFGGNLIAIITALLGVPKSRMDAKTSKAFYQNGYIHLYNYGIPDFLVESGINTDMRHGQDEFAKDFYPHQQDLAQWLQEKYVPITEDNYYFYNFTYSKQNKESLICVDQPSFIPGRECKIEYPNRIIYSDQVVNYKDFDNWLVFKANNFYDFPLSNGKLISADGIENDKVLVRFDNTTQIFSAYNTLQTSGDQIQIGNGGIFASRPLEFSATTLGYAGTQNRDLLQTEYGHIWPDARRGQIFNLAPNAQGLDEISKNGMKNWFKENLPFQIYKDFPTFEPQDLDNNFKGIGITMSFDKRFNRFFITKLDYKVLNPIVQYDPGEKEFFYRDADNNRIVVSVKDPLYFGNKSWTLSYNFLHRSWVSFHSFLPNYYVDYLDNFQSGLNRSSQSSLWSHGLTNKSYQCYYGKLYPFTIEVLTNPSGQQQVLNDISFTLEVLRYQNSF